MKKAVFELIVEVLKFIGLCAVLVIMISLAVRSL